jgi:hypothetical protein
MAIIEWENRAKEIGVLYNTHVGSAYQIGELLVAQKQEMPHGVFLQWIKENLPFSERTARRCMAVFVGVKNDKLTPIEAYDRAHNKQQQIGVINKTDDNFKTGGNTSYRTSDLTQNGLKDRFEDESISIDFETTKESLKSDAAKAQQQEIDQAFEQEALEKSRRIIANDLWGQIERRYINLFEDKFQGRASWFEFMKTKENETLLEKAKLISPLSESNLDKQVEQTAWEY